jgi:hypothetical protein
MAFAFIQEWRDAVPGTSNYDAIGSKLDVKNNPPEGLVVHTAGRDSNGIFRTFSIWESREQGQRFQEERLMPIVQERMQQQGGGEMRPPDVVDMYELHDYIHP